MNGWVSVKDGLPQRNTNVLVYCEPYDTYYVALLNNMDNWSTEDYALCGVTHWFEIPKIR